MSSLRVDIDHARDQVQSAWLATLNGWELSLPAPTIEDETAFLFTCPAGFFGRESPDGVDRLVSITILFKDGTRKRASFSPMIFAGQHDKLSLRWSFVIPHDP